MTLELKKFDMKKIAFTKDESKAPVIVLIGKRNTGKSFLIRDLLFHHTSIPAGSVISATEIVNGFYADIIPKVFIHLEFNSSIIDKVLQRQKALVKKINKQIEVNKKSSIDARTFVILDDCLYDNTWSRDKLMRLLFMNGRHWKVMLIITMQYPLGVPPVLRSNIDYVFILREPNIQNRKRIYDNYAGMFATFESFCQVMDQCTENYECLIIDNNITSNKLQDQIFWYKAQARGAYKLCSKEYWDMSKDLGSDDEEDVYTPSVHKKSGPTINVRKTKW
tara:strand:- start:1008 stop:1841 length:834 start_codon:yes stop_codon:yes gene_type:complete